jgi:transcriptional regulator with XRE-family HTH domain
MFIGNDNNTLMYQRQYIDVFDLNNTQPYIAYMSKLRENLKIELASRQWTAYDLSEACGVPQPTINRFLNSKIDEPSGKTVRKFAVGLGVTEASLRGIGQSTPDQVYEKLQSISNEDRIMIELMIDKCVQSPAQPSPAQLASRTEQNRTEQPTIEQQSSHQEQQTQDRRVMTRRKPSQFEIELAIEQERCVMERHAEAVIANERYIGLIKESCKQHECYCEPPCETAKNKVSSFSSLIGRVKSI